MSTLAAEALAGIRPSSPVTATRPVGELGRYRYLLLLRFAIVNLTGLALLASTWLQGWIQPILASDDTRLCALIFAVFLGGLLLAGRKVLALSEELNELEAPTARGGSKVAAYLADIAGRDAQVRSNVAAALKLKLAYRIAGIRHVASSLVLLGLIGTVVGFVIALSGVDPDSVAEVSAIGPMVSRLLEGMGVALYTTLVGSVLNIWLMLNHRLIEGGAIHLITHLIERGERDARA